MKSKFTLRSPVVEQSDSLRENLEESHTIKMSNTDVLPLADVRVLVVDREIDNRELVAIILEQAGATVLTTASAKKALEAIANEDFDVMLCDVGMPETDGYALLCQIQAQFPDKQMSTIALTAFVGAAHQHLTRMVRFQMHIVKPIEPTSLVAAVASLCGTIDLGE